MNAKRPFSKTGDSEPSPPLLFRLSWFALLSAAILLLVFLLQEHTYRPSLYAGAFVAVLLALPAALYLHLRAWYEERKNIHATELEFTSVYQHVLDAILILDDRGTCLDANPAAFALLGAPPVVLLGHSLGQFYEDRGKFALQWQAFL